ncbi:MAG: hypothetical protein U9N13_01835 [Euryarchaeota archaeon]|nr:hypothetical protein [Euryarchaeota archaeon]
MKHPPQTIIVAFMVLSLLFSCPAAAMTIPDADDTVIIDQTIHDDLYIGGGNIIITGTVLGDVMACAGNIEVSGTVVGDVLVGAGSVTISGNVEDDVRVGAGTLTISGNIGDDLVAGTGDLILSKDANIGGDMLIGSGRAVIRGNVNGNITGNCGEVILGGTVGGDVDLEEDVLTILPEAYIVGNLTYSGPAETAVPSGTVLNSVHFTMDDTTTGTGTLSIVWWVFRYGFLLLMGLMFLLMFPDQLAAASRTVPQAPLKNLATGFVIVLGSFAGSIVLLITMIGIPPALILLFLIIFLLYAARLVFGLWLGNLLFSKIGTASRPWLEMTAGLLLLLILTSIPWIGNLIYLAVTFVSIGSIYHVYRNRT